MSTDPQKQAIAEAWATALDASGTHAFAAAPATALTTFCKDWPTAKAVLQALQPHVPQPGPIIIGIILALGDAAFGKLCPR